MIVFRVFLIGINSENGRVPAVVIGHLRETEFLDKKNTSQTKTKIFQ